MPAWLIPAALAGASAIGGYLGNRNRSTQRTTSTTTPTFAGAGGAAYDRLLSQSMRRMSGGGGYDAARNITSTNLQNVGVAGGAARTGLMARLASMGVRGEAAGSAVGNLDAGIFGQQVNTLNQQPMLARQFTQEDIAQMLEVLGMGRGTSTTGTMTGTQTEGGGLAGGFSDIGEMLGFLYSNGMLGGGGGRGLTGSASRGAGGFPGFGSPFGGGWGAP